jgi:hypothetical protein
MFPCKVKVEQLDKTNKKVKDADIKANKALSKGKIKKVASQEGERTPFYYLGGYFENNGKPVGDFLSFGNSLKLEKHFVQNEMKKSKTSFIEEKVQDPKRAAMGEIYVEKNVIYFEPHDKCKVPESKWPKILKDLKEYFSGMKAVAIINGKVLAAEELDGSGSPETASTTAEPDSEEDIQEIDGKVTIKELADDYKDLLGEFKEAQKTEHDVDVAKLLYKEIVVWRKNFKKLDKDAQEKLSKHNTSCEATLLDVKKIIKVDQNIGEEVKNVIAVVTKYLGHADHESGIAQKQKQKAEELLEKILKYCKFVNAKKLTKKCHELQGLLAS